LIDGNASIWCNVHGHGHPRILAAVRDQLERFAHTSSRVFSPAGDRFGPTPH
jgi:adenosylmethionine-8-amino-7-oxononanoate aminotransferase